MADEKTCPLQRAAVMANPEGEGIYQSWSSECLQERCRWWTDYYDFRDSVAAKDCVFVALVKTLRHNP